MLLKYGQGTIEVQIPENAEVDILAPRSIQPISSVDKALTVAFAQLENDEPDLLPVIKGEGTVSIAIPDETRPLPITKVLPSVLEWLFLKIPDLIPERVTIIVGGGLHPPVDKTVLERIVPPKIVSGCKVIAHDALSSPLVNYGVTERGTPIQVNSAFATADYKIVIGQIDPHQFVGFTGGSKGVIIGCGGEATIEHNHSLMFDDKAAVGVLEGNPVREDLNEAGEVVGIDLSVNFIMAPNKDIVSVLVGKPLEMLHRGARKCAEIYGVEIKEPYDIVVASCGGYPKDICLYQAQKGLNLASQAVKEGGNILLLAASPQGVGDDVYFDYVSQFTSPDEVLKDFRKQGFRMGAHKAYLFGRTLSRFDVAVCSELEPGILQKCHLRAADPSEVIRDWVDEFEGTPRIGIVPNANTTYFYSKTGR